MFFALGRIKLRFPAVKTIKERRHALNSFIARTKKMNVSIVDVSGKSEIDRAEIAFAFVAPNEAGIDSMFEKIESAILKNGEIEVVEFGKNVVVLDED